MTWFAIKAPIDDLCAQSFAFPAQKTMYGGKDVAVGDTVFVFASGRDEGTGLIARGTVTDKADVPRTAAIRQTPRVSIAITRTGTARWRLGRIDLRAFRGRSDGAPEAELDFKLYRQATDKIVGLTDHAGAFLNGLIDRL